MTVLTIELSFFCDQAITIIENCRIFDGVKKLEPTFCRCDTRSDTPGTYRKMLYFGSMSISASQIKVQDIAHLGLVAGIIDEMGLVEEIKQLLGTHPQEIISAGQVVKAMFINGLGFISAPLYLFQKFFEGIATEHLQFRSKGITSILGTSISNHPQPVRQATATPSWRWMFQCFMSIHLLTIAGLKQISNLNEERCWILQFFGDPCRKYYLLC